ncbi:MAG: AmmeMemoRadiSam system protein B [Dactylosporangium sp.]|nr:AmmeMemoRadiSam system protein B [Dactylosporangium sp.]NNJ59675.1 AmmeMemoRadiSam system protein B [Dactylosporangium sp.]
MTTRPPAVAGLFYPANPEALIGTIDRLVAAIAVAEGERLAEAYIVPHAGYRYSGPVAAEVYARLRRHAADIDRIVLLGPAHRIPLAGLAVTGATRWNTPLGSVTIDGDGIAAVTAAGAMVDDAPHAEEHSLEVQVPFLQRVLDRDIPLLPVCVGWSTAEQVAAVIEAALRDPPRTVVLCSTDLSHYLPDAEAQRRDARTAAAVMELSPDDIETNDACGVFALRGLLHWAGAEPRARAVRLALATSAATGGDPSRVVGYAAFALHRPGPNESVEHGEDPSERDQAV